MNPLADWHRSGGVVAYGTDAPVTPLAGWAMVADAVRHSRPDQRVGVGEAFAAATRGGHLAAGDTDAGLLAPGQRAHLAVWDAEPGSLDEATGLPDLAGGAPLPGLRRAAGRRTGGSRSGGSAPGSARPPVTPRRVPAPVAACRAYVLDSAAGCGSGQALVAEAAGTRSTTALARRATRMAFTRSRTPSFR